MINQSTVGGRDCCLKGAIAARWGTAAVEQCCKVHGTQGHEGVWGSQHSWKQGRKLDACLVDAPQGAAAPHGSKRAGSGKDAASPKKVAFKGKVAEAAEDADDEDEDLANVDEVEDRDPAAVAGAAANPAGGALAFVRRGSGRGGGGKGRGHNGGGKGKGGGRK